MENLLIANPFKSKDGQGLLEFALILGGVALVAIVALSITGTSLRGVYCQVVSGVGGQGCGCSYAFGNLSEFDDWEKSGGKADISIEGGRACFTGEGRKASTFLNSCTEDFGTEDFVINVNSVTVEKSQGNRNPGFDVKFRSPDENNGYQFTYNPKQNVARFWKLVNGKWILLSSRRPPPEWANGEFDVQIKVEGNTFTAYHNGSPIVQATDDAYTQGQVGLRNKPSSKTCIGSMSVQKLP